MTYIGINLGIMLSRYLMVIGIGNMLYEIQRSDWENLEDDHSVV